MLELIGRLELEIGKNLDLIDVHEMKPTQLAYLGDAIYELFVRSHMLLMYKVPVQKLHERSVYLVRASTQAKALQGIKNMLSEEELLIVKRGRNAKTTNIPSGSNMIEYRRATAFESLLGFLFLTGEYDRLFEIMLCALKSIEKKDLDGEF